ncbi:MAG: hypothetical protein ACI9T8_000066 [Candidatus Saccharimonadales bacterium]|jgi:hypothetical protein
MPVILIIALIGLVFLLAVGISIYIHSRKLWREQKNYERGLKMVPLLIHLPPASSDTEVGSRDERDVTDETISKAQTLYNIIASTTQKGFKSNFYGQRHISFEIVGSKGFIYFYAAVPVALIEVVNQAITSAYPTARLEEVAEHNIFSPTGRTNGTMGGELSLKEDSAYPIATFQELKRDTLQSLLNALSTLDKEDGAGIQILMRPASESWRKNALAKADKKRKGNDGKSSKGSATSGFFKDLLFALHKPPEEKEKKPEDKQISGSDQALVEAIEEKARHAAFEVSIKLIASSNVSQKAQSILNNLVATFALYNSPGKNGFKFSAAKDIDSFITSYILRFFPQESNKSVLNSVELATLFHFPTQSNIPTTQLERQAFKQVDGPRNVPDEGLVLGYNVFRGSKKKIVLSLDDRRRHVYFVGQTGVGKTTFLQNLALQDMMNGDGFAFIDPHGDVADELLSIVPKERTEDVIYFCPSDVEYPLGLNMFEFDEDRPEQKDFLIQESLSMLYKLYDPQKQGIIGPRFERIFTNAALLLMADPQGGTFVDIPKLLIDQEFMEAKLKYVTDQNVLDFWQKEWPNSQKSNDAGEVTSWVVSKFGAFLSNEMMRNIIGQTKSSFNMREIMDQKKILIVNLSKGRTGEMNSKLLGMIFVMKFQAAAMSRADVDRSERTDFCLYVDEFQNYSTDSFADIMSEARKFGLNLIVANQFTTQLSDEVRDAVFGNIGTVVALRVGIADAEFLAKQFAPSFDTDDLQKIPNGNAAVRTMIHGVPTQPFSMAGLPPVNVENKELSSSLKQLSAAKYGRPKVVVDKEITARISTVEKAKPQGAAAPRTAKKPSSGSSFLDDWMDKKQSNSFKAPASPFNQQAPQAPSIAQPPIPQPLQPQQPLQAAQQPLPHQNSASQQLTAPAPQPVAQQPLVPAQQQPLAPLPAQPLAAPVPQPAAPTAVVDQDGHAHIPIHTDHDETVSLR